MKRDALSLLLALGLITSPLCPSMAGTRALSDDDLGKVSAQGFQVKGENNTFHSFQLGGDSQLGVSVMSIRNTASVAANIEQDVHSYVSDFDVVSVKSVSLQATNTKASDQTQIFTAPVKKVNNNNGSLQLSDSAQKTADAMSLLNAADSAVNIYQKANKIDSSQGISLQTQSDQEANNSGFDVQTIVNADTVKKQNNNNASVQLSGEAQASASGLSLANVSGSAQNISQMVAGVRTSKDIGITQENVQSAINIEADTQDAINGVALGSGPQGQASGPLVTKQNNNNGAVQMRGEVQKAVSGMLVTNTAASAMNAGQNLIYGGDGEFSGYQTNDQFAGNNVDTGQYIENVDARRQNNNNGSVQLKGSAQTLSETMALTNTANSAINAGQNVVSAVKLFSDEGEVNNFTQKNYQQASNGIGFLVGPTGQADQIAGDDQGVSTGSAVSQNNNSGSVQARGNAQGASRSMAIANTAFSAINIGQNLASLKGDKAFNEIDQFNRQQANNGSAEAVWYQTITNGESRRQSNNMGSVQAKGSAQAGVNALVLANTANSAVNVGQNVITTGFDQGRSAADQDNVQSATNGAGGIAVWIPGTGSYQAVINGAGGVVFTKYQSNNNSSVQVTEEAQKGAKGLILTNTANSALNVGQNLLSGERLTGELEQTNSQAAGSGVYTDQIVANSSAISAITIGQATNNGSVQMEGGQQGATGLALANTAVSALNVGQNIVKTEPKGLHKVAQTNDQSAYNATEAVQLVVNGTGGRQIRDIGLLSLTVGQDNNNGSIQVKMGAQEEAKGLVIANTAGSAFNIGQNLAAIDTESGLRSLKQKNLQESDNYTAGLQTIDNSVAVVEVDVRQNNNNASVQASKAQNQLEALSFPNLAASAVNVGQNVASLSAGKVKKVAQKNRQEATNVTASEQITANLAGAAISLGQVNDNASVQLTESQNKIEVVNGVNGAASAVNVGQNMAGISVNERIEKVVQKNRQAATNSTQVASSNQDVLTLGLISVSAYQDNNNGSVQLKGSQNKAKAVSLANIAESAANVGQNLLSLDCYVGTVKQVNDQSAIGGTNIADSHTINAGAVAVSFQQNNNSASVQANESQNGLKAVNAVNAAGSAANVGQNLASIDAGTIGTLTQVNLQNSLNPETVSLQVTANGSVFVEKDAYQNNNNGSIQLINSENWVNALALTNLAGSGANVGQNVASVGSGEGVGKVTQQNSQVAALGSLSDQTVLNVKLLELPAESDRLSSVSSHQNNNNASVQAESSQNDIKVGSLLNAASSAVNMGENIARAKVQASADLDQSNIQSATVMARADQAVLNWNDETKEQNNNNASTQIKGSGSQKRLTALSVANMAGSAGNVGQNITSVNGKDVTGLQSNLQQTLAVAGSFQAVQNIPPRDDVEWTNLAAYQNNNNSSVQLRDSQTEAKSLSILNAAASAVNIGQNIAKVEAEAAAFRQLNEQTAAAIASADQEVSNDKVLGQNNNTGSVQVIDSQTTTTAPSIMNTALSAVNVGQNILSVKGKEDVSASQTNLQLAVASVSTAQTVNNYGTAEYQNNNEASVQQIDSQFNSSALSIANIAGSAANFGQNIVNMNGVKGATLMQLNLQKAVKF